MTVFATADQTMILCDTFSIAFVTLMPSKDQAPLKPGT